MERREEKEMEGMREIQLKNLDRMVVVPLQGRVGKLALRNERIIHYFYNIRTLVGPSPSL